MTAYVISGITTDLAHGKPAVQSSTRRPSRDAGCAVDGDASTSSATHNESNPFWSVDLGMSTYIDHLFITNFAKSREPCHYDFVHKIIN